MPKSETSGSIRQQNKENQPASLLLGPGFIVAAAIVSPSTVMSATIVGAGAGLDGAGLVAVVVLATIILQEMAARLGTLTGIGLGEILRRQFLTQPAIFTLLAAALVIALGFGSAVVLTRNLEIGAAGLRTLVPLADPLLVLILAIVAGGLLEWGSFRVLERVLIANLGLMGLAFVGTAAGAVGRGAWTWEGIIPTFPPATLGSMLTLVGTMIVPSHLFLHASAASARWSSIRPRGEGLRLARRDTVIGIVIGGVVTAAIVVAAAAGLRAEDTPSPLFSLGLFAAGFSSALVAPLAAALALSGLLGWSRKNHPARFRMVWIGVLLLATIAAIGLEQSPALAILLADVAGSLILPIIASVLLMACNMPLLGSYKNRRWHNALTILVIAIMATLPILRLFVA